MNAGGAVGPARGAVDVTDAKGCLSHGTTLAMVFKPITTASKTRRRLMGNNQLPKVIEGVRFKDGMQIDETKTRAAA